MKLSIITINYNNVEGLRKTIDSVLCQTWRDFEWIFIDGGSTDGSKELIEKTAAECPNVSYWCSEPDKGVYNAMNKGIAHAQGEYLNFMNSGDTYYCDTILEYITGFFDGTDIICGATKYDDNSIVKAPDSISGCFFILGYTMCHQSSFIRADLQKRYLYDEKLRIVSDRKFFIQVFLFNNASYKGLDEIVSVYSTGGISSDSMQLKEELDSMIVDLFPSRLLYMINGYIYGNNTIEKLFVQLRTNKYRKSVYLLIVSVIKFFSMFKRGGCWIDKFPLFLKY